MILEAPDESCWLGVLRLSLRIPGARSLKDKRRAVGQIRDRLRANKNLSVAETGHLEDHHHAILAVVLVANDQRFIRSALAKLAHEVSGWRSALVEDATIQVNRPGDDSAQNQYDDFING